MWGKSLSLIGSLNDLYMSGVTHEKSNCDGNEAILSGLYFWSCNQAKVVVLAISHQIPTYCLENIDNNDNVPY